MGSILLAKSACLILCTSHQLADNFSGFAFLILQVHHLCAFPHLNNKHLRKAESDSTRLSWTSVDLGWQTGELWAEGYRQGRALILEAVLCKGKKIQIYFVGWRCISECNTFCGGGVSCNCRWNFAKSKGFNSTSLLRCLMSCVLTCGYWVPQWLQNFILFFTATGKHSCCPPKPRDRTDVASAALLVRYCMYMSKRNVWKLLFWAIESC